MFRSLLVLLVLVLSTLPGFAQDAIGKITFVDGSVVINREGSALPAAQVIEGTVVENLDQIKTGADGQLEIAFDKATGLGSVLKVRPNTMLTLEITSLKSEQTGTIALLTGSVALKVQKLTGTSRLNISTDAAVMGVRGTEFQVDAEPLGPVLLTTSEGKVECTTDEGKSLFSIPGQAVAQSFEGEWAVDTVTDSDVNVYRGRWQEGNTAILLKDPTKHLQTLADRYEALEAEYSAKVQKVTEDGPAFKAFQQGALPADRQAELGDDLRELRDLNLKLEGLRHRLQTVGSRLEKAHVAPVKLKNGEGFDSLIRRIDQGRGTMESRGKLVGVAAKAFAKKNGGSLPPAKLRAGLRGSGPNKPTPEGRAPEGRNQPEARLPQGPQSANPPAVNPAPRPQAPKPAAGRH